MRVIALDLGTRTGFAIQSGRTTISGTMDFTPKRFESSAMRFVRFRQWITELVMDGPCHIAFEEVRRHMGTDAAHCYGGLLAHLLEITEVNGIACEGIPVGTIKRHATGKGNAGKPLMIDAALNRWPHQDVQDDNHADALCLLDYILTRDKIRVPRGEQSANLHINDIS